MLLVVVSAASLVAPARALAAPPPNDDFGHATPIAAVPTALRVDTADATHASDDPVCLGAVRTVWYRFTPATSGRYQFRARGKPEGITLSVWHGRRGALVKDLCTAIETPRLPAVARADLRAGVTYHVMLGTTTDVGGPTTLSVSLPPLPHVFVWVSGATVDRLSGVVTVRGTVRCNAAAFGGDITVEISQTRGGLRAEGSAIFFLDACQPTPVRERWQLDIESTTDRAFLPGTARAVRVVDSCDGVECLQRSRATILTLAGS